MDGSAEREGAAISKARKYRLRRPRGTRKRASRKGPIGSNKKIAPIIYPPKPLIPKQQMPDWLEKLLL